MAEQNPFLSLFASHEDAQRAEQSTEKEAHELDKTLVRILLINGHGELQEQRCFDRNSIMSVLPLLPITVGEGRAGVPPTKFSVRLPQFSRNEEHRGRNGCMTLDNFDKVSCKAMHVERTVSTATDFERSLLCV